jgi:syntaxin 7
MTSKYLFHDISLDNEEDEKTGLIKSQKRKQLQQLKKSELHNSLIHDQAEGIKQIEQDMTDLNNVFVDVALLVKDQQQQFDRIDDNIEHTIESTTNGVTELQKAAAYQESSRKMKCCIFITILIIVAVIILVLILGISFGQK